MPKKPEAPPAVVLGLTCNGLSVARSLGRHGVTVFGIDQDGRLPGMFSRYCRAVRADIAGSPDDNPSGWLEFLVRLAKTLPEPPVLFPSNDASVLLISRHRETLRPYYRFNLPDPDITEALINKTATYDLARGQGIPCPHTFTVRSREELEALAPTLHYPYALKPVYSHLWRARASSHDKLVVAQSPPELLAAYDEASRREIDVLITEIIPGSDERLYALYTYFDRTSRPLIVFTKRKIRQYPVDYGIGSMHVSEREPVVAELGLRLLKGIDYRGIGVPEFKLDPRDRQYKLMEVHVRCGLPIGLATASGIDVPYIAYRDIIGDPLPPTDSFREGVKWVCFEWDFFSFLSYRARGQLTWRQWLRSLRGPKTYAYFSWGDPVPFLISLKGFARHLAQGLSRRLARAGRRAGVPRKEYRP